MGSSTGVIAAGHEQTAAAGIEVFRRGGNAFDAAVGACLAAFCAEPTLTSPGGSGFLLAHTASGHSQLFDFFSQTPRLRRPDATRFYAIEADFGDALQEFYIGPGSVAVPGNIAGLFHVQRRLGRLPMAEVAAPAITLAREGLEVSSFQSFCMGVLRPILLANSETQRLFTSSGALLQPGDRFANPEWAELLRWLVAEGAQVFYEGEIAQRIAATCAEGGHLTLEDLRSYQVYERAPLTCSYRGYTVLTNPAPSVGGSLIAFALALLAPLKASEFGSPAHLERLLATMQLMDEARHSDLGAELCAPAVLSHYRQRLAAANRWGSTTHISTLDSEGNAAAITTTNGEGSACVVPGTGFMLNNMLGEDDLHPEGFNRWPENTRIGSMMAPTLVLDGGEPWLVLGSGGSKRIRTALLQVLINRIDFGMDLQSAIGCPRLHWEEGTLHLEPGLEIFTEAERVVCWQQPSFFFGGVHAVSRADDGMLTGVGDPRRNGIAFAS